MKPTIRNLLVIALAVFITGCASGTHIVTGKKREPIKPEDVTIYQIKPNSFEYVGIVNAHSSGKRQRHMDSVVKGLKVHAAKIGANGILLGNVDPGRESTGVTVVSGYANSGAAFASGGGSAVGVTSSGIYLSGIAIYVQP